MGRTVVGICKDRFTINGLLTYQDIPGSNPDSHGLLWNQRLIQGIFDDAGHRALYNQLALDRFDPDANTDALIAALPEWYDYGMRAFTVGFQGGWPVGMTEVEDIDNNPFGPEGLVLDEAYASRMDRVITAADKLGMVMIVNILYWAQAKKMKSGRAVRSAVSVAARFLKEKGYTNVLIDVANEYDISLNKAHAIIQTAEGIASLIDLARTESGGMLTASSGGGGTVDSQVADAGDFVLVHGNGLTRGQYYDFLKRAIRLAKGKPVLCNEDSPCCTRVDVALMTGTSWGYYNNYTKQIPPCFFGVTPGEDLFFARRMARAVGIPVKELLREEQFVLQGLRPEEAFGGGLRALRLAAEYPEQVDRVEFYRNGAKFYVSYDEPFFVDCKATWLGTPFSVAKGERYSADIYLTGGEVVRKEYTIV